MKLVTLISCMHQKNHDIVSRSNVQSDCIVINQCDIDKIDEFDFINKFGETKHCKFISTTERGLSRSRNMAIANAPDDAICLLCDDDEIFEENYCQIIMEFYENNPTLDFCCFYIKRPAKKCPPKKFDVNYKNFWSIASVEISFRRSAIISDDIKFDTRLGSGANSCGGEENKFILDLIKTGKKGVYMPIAIGLLLPSDVPTWFRGYTYEYFNDRAKFSRIILGPICGRLYGLYFILNKLKLIKKINPETSILKSLWISLR